MNALSSVFSQAERAYLSEGAKLGRLATVDSTGAPHVVPVGWTYNTETDTIDIGGHDFERTRKFRNILANPKVCFVVDDVLPPWQPRCVQVRGLGAALGADAGGPMIRITPDKVVSWGLRMEGADAG